MSDYFKTDSGNRIIIDGVSGSFGFVHDPCGVQHDSPGVIEDTFSVKRDFPSPHEFQLSHARYLFAPMEPNLAIAGVPPVPAEFSGKLTLTTPVTGMEHTSSHRRDFIEPLEIVFFVPRNFGTPLEIKGGVNATPSAPMSVNGMVVRDCPGAHDHTLSVMATWASVIDITNSVHRDTSGPVEHPLAIVSRPPISTEWRGSLLRDFPSVIESKELLVITSASVPEESGGGVMRGAVISQDRLATVMAKRAPHLAFSGSLTRDEPSPLDETSGVVVGLAPVPHEHLTIIRSQGALPEEWRGSLQRDFPAIAAWKALLSRSAAAVEEYLTKLQVNPSAALEHASGVLAHNHIPVAFSGSVLSQSVLGGEFVTHIIQAAAGAIENLTAIRSHEFLGTEWRGSILADWPIGAENLLAIIPTNTAPMPFEITVSVKRDSGIPLNFHGYAFIITPTLLGTKGAINLQGVKGQILLIGTAGGGQ